MSSFVLMYYANKKSTFTKIFSTWEILFLQFLDVCFLISELIAIAVCLQLQLLVYSLDSFISAPESKTFFGISSWKVSKRWEHFYMFKTAWDRWVFITILHILNGQRGQISFTQLHQKHLTFHVSILLLTREAYLQFYWSLPCLYYCIYKESFVKLNWEFCRKKKNPWEQNAVMILNRHIFG